MVKPPCATAFDNKPNSDKFHTVFVDTSLDTHMAMVVGESDTVADFKKKIRSEHALCFPEIGEININALQVKHKGFLYHLSDLMCVRSVFDGVKSRWFVRVDACSEVKQRLGNAGNLTKLNGLLRLEHNVLEDRVDERLNEGSNVPNGGNGEFKQLVKKRKLEDSENPVDRNLLNVNFSSGCDDMTIIRKKKHKIQKTEEGSPTLSNTKMKNLTADASYEGALNSVLDINAALLSVPSTDARLESVNEQPEKSEPSTKQKKKKKKKNKSTEVPAPLEVNERDNVKDTTNSAGNLNSKTLGTQSIEEALHNSDQLAGYKIDSVDKNTLLPMSPLKIPLENQKLADPREFEHTAETPEALPDDGAIVPVKSGGKGSMTRKEKGSRKNKKAKAVTELEIVKTTEVEMLSTPNAEMSNISNLGVVRKFDEVGSHAAVGASNGGSVMADIIVPDGSHMQVVKARKTKQNVSQLNDISDLNNPIPVVEKDIKKSKRKRSSATNLSESQLQEKFDNASQSTDGIISKDKSVENKNGNKATSVGISSETPPAVQVEGKHHDSALGTNPSVYDIIKDDKLSSGTEEIMFRDYFVPSQQKAEVVAPGDAENVVDECIAAKGKTWDSELKEKSTFIQDGKKPHVESSQESLLMRQSHEAVLHSDTESFRVPKDRTINNSSKQKLKSSHKKSKQVNSGIAAPHSPSASETQKSNSSKLNKTHHMAVTQYQAKGNAETLTASNYTLKSPVSVQRPKPKQPISKNSSAVKVEMTETVANRRKTLLSANIFKDDNDESSEDEDDLDTGHRAVPYEDNPDVSVVSEMEGDTEFATAASITVGQRIAAEVDSDSSQNKYTLEKLRMEKVKRDQESGIQPEDFLLDIQADENL